MEEKSESVVGEVAEAVADAFDLFDEGVGRFGRPVGHSCGVEVGEQLVAPAVEGAGQPHQFGDLVGGDGGEPGQQPPLGLSSGLGLVDQPEVLGGDPSSGDLLVIVAGVESDQHPGPGVLTVMIVSATQQPADPEQRITLAAPVAEGVVLDPSADLVDCVEAEPDDMERIEYPDRIRQAGT